MRRRQSLEPSSSIVEYHPEELDELSPLKLDEADDVQLAEFFEDHDFSFLFVPPHNVGVRESSGNDVGNGRRKRKLPQEQPPKHHRIPPTDEVDENMPLLHKNKKRRLDDQMGEVKSLLR